MKKLRISGVVKAMNQARDRLGRGLLPSEAEDFRRWVRGMISEVERISRLYGTKPEKLPAPTFRAYQFLKSIDLKDLPITEHPSNEPASGFSGRGKVRVSNLIAISSAIQRELSGLAANLDTANKRADTLRALSEGGSFSKLRQRIETTVSSVEKICREAGSSPADLPGPSSRAYLWLKFLSNPDYLQKHLLNLSLALAACRSAACRKSMSPVQKKLPIWFEFYNLPALYRTKVSGDGIKIIASEAFITAPQGIIESLVCAALTRKTGQYADKLRRYAQTEQFQRVLSYLMPAGTPAVSFSRGKHYDLEESFERVNSEYFQGRMERPVLTWNKTITHRKLGHYQPASDTLMVSISLDRADVPEYLVDYVMYHELLHKALGVHLTNGRQYAHTREFREAERKFHRYAEAEETLKRLGKKLAP
jgi:hypothetical protein